MLWKICVSWTQLWRLCDQDSSGWGSYESHSSHSLRNINEHYVLWNFWKFLKALFFMLFIHSGSKYAQNPVCSFPYHLFVSWKIWLLSGSYGAIVYWFLHFMFLVWHSFLWKRILISNVNSPLPKQDAMVCTDGPRRYIFVSACRFQLFHDWNLFTIVCMWLKIICRTCNCRSSWCHGLSATQLDNSMTLQANHFHICKSSGQRVEGYN